MNKGAKLAEAKDQFAQAESTFSNALLKKEVR